jgi:hypothetical protein
MKSALSIATVVYRRLPGPAATPPTVNCTPADQVRDARFTISQYRCVVLKLKRLIYSEIEDIAVSCHLRELSWDQDDGLRMLLKRRDGTGFR